MTVLSLVRRAGIVLGGLAGIALMTTAVPASAAPVDEPGVLRVKTVPKVAGARVAADGNVTRTNKRGRAALRVPHFRRMDKRLNLPSTRIGKHTRVYLDRVLGNPAHGVSGKPVVVGLNTERLVSWDFTARGRKWPASDVESMELKSSTGQIVILEGKDVQRPIWLHASRTQQTPKGLVSKDLYWTIRSVVVDGAEVVNRGQQKFFPTQSVQWTIDLLFYRVEFSGTDLLFGGYAGEGIEVTGPDGVTIREPFVNGMASLDNMPRGSYDVRVYGTGISFLRPLGVSKDQIVEIEVITRFDVGVIAGVVGLTAISLVLVGRRHHIIRLGRRLPRRGMTRAAVAVVALACVAAVLAPVRPAAAAGPDDPPPTWAYYYIWFQPSSWLRAKTDYPLLGRYSSDDPVAARRHIEMARRAGITGFLVSWKHTAHLSHRLEMVADIAVETDFELGIVYQGLDFHRNPLPADQIEEDLEDFAAKYHDHPAFDAFGKPVVVITGTEDYSVEDLELMTRNVRDRLHVLASAKSSEEYRRTASVMDGNAYYWSSGDPSSDYYRERLEEMAAVVRADKGLWFAPATAGYDARQLGGHRVIGRQQGQTINAALEVARSTDPDAVAVISWNEFSENTHIEPSRQHGIRELKALATVLGGTAALPRELESVQTPREERTGLTGWGALVVLLLLAALLNFYMAFRRPRAPTGPGGPSTGPHFTPGHRGGDQPVNGVPAGPFHPTSGSSTFS